MVVLTTGVIIGIVVGTVVASVVVVTTIVVVIEQQKKTKLNECATCACGEVCDETCTGTYCEVGECVDGACRMTPPPVSMDQWEYGCFNNFACIEHVCTGVPVEYNMSTVYADYNECSAQCG
jgi:hypothetical protein